MIIENIIPIHSLRLGRLKDKFSSFKIKYKFESFSDFALSFCLSHNFDYVIPE